MKRYLAVFLALILVLPVLALPAFAAELFEFVPVDYAVLPDFAGQDGGVLVYHGYLPEGDYSIERVFLPDGATVDFGDVSISWSPVEGSSNEFISSFYNSSLQYNFDFYMILEDGSYSTFLRVVAPSGQLNFNSRFLFHVVPTDFKTIVSNIVSSDMLNFVVFQILGLLPVALVTVVGFVGIRKGIAFVRRLLVSA